MIKKQYLSRHMNTKIHQKNLEMMKGFDTIITKRENKKKKWKRKYMCEYMREYNKRDINCECGSTVKRSSYYKHLGSMKHKKNMASKP